MNNQSSQTKFHASTIINKCMIEGEIVSEEARPNDVTKDGNRAYLRCGNRLFSGKWVTLNDQIVFRLDAIPTSSMAGKTFQVYDFYWGERVELVLDETLSWTKVSSSEHDHCEICWASLGSPLGESTASIYQSSKGNSVCCECYRNYVAVRCLSFITTDDGEKEKGSGAGSKGNASRGSG